MNSRFKTLKVLYTDLKKSVFSLGFAACAAITAILCFTSPGFSDTETNRAYRVFEAILYIDWQTLAKEGVSGMNLIFGGLYGYCNMFMPIIAALPFVTAFCNERNTGNIRLNIIRTGKMRYYISKYLSAIISAGTAVVLGCIIYAVVVYSIFPTDSDCKEFRVLVMPHDERGVKEFLGFIPGVFMYGAISVLPAFFLSGFVKNHYLITCIPFMLTYFLRVSLNKLGQSGILDKMENVPFLLKNYSAFYPDNMILWNSGYDFVPTMLIYNGICILVTLLSFIIFMELRTDKGE